MIKKIIDLGYHPLADSFLTKRQLILEKRKKLECFLDTLTKRIYLKSKFPANYRYNNVTYSYTSSNSSLSRKHWNIFYKINSAKYKIINKKILEIGSNDGYLLSKFKNKNFILGIDSSKQMAKISNKKKIPCLNMIFNNVSSKYVNNKYGKFDFILANHVLNHADNEIKFLKGAKNLLKENSILIIEVPYWGYQVKKLYFDQIYHEHRCYFTVSYLDYLQKKLHLKIIDLQITNYHGKSLRIFFSKKNSKYKPKKIDSFIKYEKKIGLFNLKTYDLFMKKINFKKRQFQKKIHQLIENNKIIAIGASAKGNTFLNFMNLNYKIISAVTDNSYYKIGKYTPGSHIKIYKDDIFKKYKNIYAIVLSWNFSKMLKKNVLKYNKKIKFIK